MLTSIENAKFAVYERITGMLWVLLFYSYLDIYNSINGLLPIKPRNLIIFLTILTLPIIYKEIKDKKWSLVNHLAIFLVFVFIVFSISLCSYFTYENLALFKNQILCLVFLGVSYLSFLNPNSQIAARYTMLVCLAFTVLINFAEVIHPIITAYGRSAGLYMNPNISALAIPLGLALTIPLIPEKYRISSILLTGGAVLGTLSRGGMIAFAICLMMIYFQGFVNLKLNRKEILNNSIILLIVLLILVCGYTFNPPFRWSFDHQLVPVSSLTAFAHLDLSKSMNTMENITDNGNADEQGNNSSSQELQNIVKEGLDNSDYIKNSGRSRIWLLGTALAMYKTNPLWGSGMDKAWALTPHNEYLLLAVAYGAIGWLILPLLALTVFLCGDRRISLSIGVILLVAGLISHNLMVDRMVLVSLALAAALKYENLKHEL